MDFIWRNKPHRIAKSHMKCSLKMGSLAVPDLALYYQASVLTGLLKLYNPVYDSEWKQMENDLLHPHLFTEYYGILKLFHLTPPFSLISFWRKSLKSGIL